jgi:hypothetical protein
MRQAKRESAGASTPCLHFGWLLSPNLFPILLIGIHTKGEGVQEGVGLLLLNSTHINKVSSEMAAYALSGELRVEGHSAIEARFGRFTKAQQKGCDLFAFRGRIPPLNASFI